jgi:hypothetical protein
MIRQLATRLATAPDANVFTANGAIALPVLIACPKRVYMTLLVSSNTPNSILTFRLFYFNDAEQCVGSSFQFTFTSSPLQDFGTNYSGIESTPIVPGQFLPVDELFIGIKVDSITAGSTWTIVVNGQEVNKEAAD